MKRSWVVSLQLHVRLQAIFQPSTDIVAGGTTALQDFEMTAARTQVACPATGTGGLSLKVPLVEPGRLLFCVNTLLNVAHVTIGFIYETMTRRQTPLPLKQPYNLLQHRKDIGLVRKYGCV